MSDSLTMLVPGDPGQRTGGYLYDAHIAAQLRELGWSVRVIGLDGEFPDCDEIASAAMRDALAGLPEGSRVVIDGLALGGAPDAVMPHAGRLDLTALVHHPLADETGLEKCVRARLLDSERRALEVCNRWIVTSAFTAHRLRMLGLDAGMPSVVEPGVSPAPLAEPVSARLSGNEADILEHLLCVASLTPRKGQDLLVEALAGLADRDWRCTLVGSTARDREFAVRVESAIQEAGLGERIKCAGECDEQALSAVYREASVCVLPSRYEGYGMVVTEALARGLPLLTTTGGALADTAPDDCCIKIVPGEVGGLRDAIARWLDDAGLRRRLTERALAHRERLAGWPEAGRAFARALQGGFTR